MRDLAIVVVLLLAAVANAAAPTSATSRAADERIKAILDRPLPEVRFENIALPSVLPFFQDVTGANVVVNWGAMEKAGVTRDVPVSANMKDAPFRKAIGAILAGLQAKEPIDFAVMDGSVVISTAADLKARAALRAWHAERPIVTGHGLDKPLPQIKFEAIAFHTVIDFMRDIGGAGFVVDWQKLEAVGVTKDTPVSLRLRDVTFEETLDLILLSAGGGALLDYTVADGKIRIEPAAKE